MSLNLCKTDSDYALKQSKTYSEWSSITLKLKVVMLKLQENSQWLNLNQVEYN